ncbi:hypothetical protein ACP275_06G049700 [Erythranthe tilingii]
MFFVFKGDFRIFPLILCFSFYLFYFYFYFQLAFASDCIWSKDEPTLIVPMIARKQKGYSNHRDYKCGFITAPYAIRSKSKLKSKESKEKYENLPSNNMNTKNI